LQFGSNRRFEITEFRYGTNQALRLCRRSKGYPEMLEQLRLRPECVPLNNVGFDGNDCSAQLIQNGPVLGTIQVFGGLMNEDYCSVSVLPGLE
jgi:hypothetical protein